MTNIVKNATQPNNSKLMMQVSDDLTVQVTPNKQYEFLMTTSEVAHGYDCSTDAILAAKNRNLEEFEDGKHYFTETDKLSSSGNLQTTKMYWTKRGIVRLGFFIKTGRAKLFRDWAEDLIIGKLESKYLLPLNDDEKLLMQLIKNLIVVGDVKKIAEALGITANHVSAVKNGRKRSLRVMEALVEQSKINKKLELSTGYQKTFITKAITELQPKNPAQLELFNTKTENV